VEDFRASGLAWDGFRTILEPDAVGRYIVEQMKILSRKRASRRSIAFLVAVSQFAITLAPALHPLLHHDLVSVASDSETAVRQSGTEYRSENHDTCFLCRVVPETQVAPDMGQITLARPAVEPGLDATDQAPLSRTFTATYQARAPPSC
jgi:hypothetical protein